MTLVLTLIAAPTSKPVVEDIAAKVQAKLGTAAPHWLAPGEACDLNLSGGGADVLPAVREIIADAAVDAVVQPVAHRRKRLLIADMDSTIIQQECLDEIATVAGIGPRIAEITERAMRGELNFESALRERVGLLKGFPVAKLRRVLDERITLTPGARLLTRTMAAHGGRCVLVSGGFLFFTSAVAELAGFAANYGNDFIIADGAIQGVAEPILGRDAKLATLKAEAEKLGVELAECMATGDGANDLAMIQAAGLGVAFHAKPKVSAEAAARIDHNDLTALLYIQGYARHEWAA
jgi:phosphoserine phosphatase